MRKFAMLLLLTLSFPVMAQALRVHDAMSNIAGLIQSPFLTAIAMVGVLLASLIMLMGKDSATRALGTTIFMTCMLIPGMKLLASMAGIEAPEETPKIDYKPGIFAQSWEWAVDHSGTLCLAFFISGIAIYLVHRNLTIKSAKRRVKVELKQILDTIERVDVLLAYWSNSKPERGDGSKRYATSTIEKLKQAQDEVLKMLEQVHAGQPLSDEQRINLGKLINVINACMRDEIGTPVKVVVRLNMNEAEAQTQEGNQTTRSTYNTLRQTAKPSATGETSPSMTDYLLNPLNPLSPISPWSLWSNDREHSNQNRQEDNSSRDQDRDTPSPSFRTDDAPSNVSYSRYDSSSSGDCGGSSSSSTNNSGSEI
ncbi:hypothetical protein ACO0LB_17780 [Undibacterium sp. SXout7W]|uniref:hypothetical protein n=1 Tax=Undibacterium sp. SXout7W TaxID=3413049 RepID=UPI003BF3C5DA